ncbi:MAG: methyltransferase domain-containing protein [Nitrospinae bacterium]|nr:methyltransferase domain-containing protein [Nitrospinota bacterium]
MIYRRMKGFFRRAYEAGKHGWPTVGPTAQVVEYFDRARQRFPGGLVLDIGCGEGRHSIAFANRGHQVVALDYEPLALERARGFEASAIVRVPIRWLLADAFHLPFPPATFTIAVDYGLFHHVKVPDQARYIAGLQRVMAAGGCLLLTVFSTNFQHYPGEVRRRNWIVHRDHYDRFFTQEDLGRLFTPAFVVEEVVEEIEGHYAFHHALLVKDAA